MGPPISSNLLCQKIHLPVYKLWLTQTTEKIQKMWITEITGYGAYGNCLYYLLHFSGTLKTVLKLKVKKNKNKNPGGNVKAKRVFIEGENINDQTLKSQLDLL